MARRFEVIHACVGDGPERGIVSAGVERGGRHVVHVEAEVLAERLDSIEVLLCGFVPRIDWSQARRLRLLQAVGSGVDWLLPTKGLPEGVPIANMRGIHLPEMRDHALAMIFAFERALPRLMVQQRRREWRVEPSGSVAGKTAGILGLGEVGRSLAAACSALGMRVIGTRVTPRATPHVDEVHAPTDIERVLRAADYLVVLLPLTEESRGLLDREALGWLRPSSVVVVMSRGGIVDEVALAAALEEGRLRGAALDVFENEPLPAASPLWGLPNLLVSPHIAGLVPDYLERAVALFLENVDLIERGLPPRTRIDRQRGY